jgi:hypothetical protein
VELGRRGGNRDTLKKTAQTIAEKPRTKITYAFIRRRDDNGGEAVELGHRGMEFP